MVLSPPVVRVTLVEAEGFADEQISGVRGQAVSLWPLLTDTLNPTCAGWISTSKSGISKHWIMHFFY